MAATYDHELRRDENTPLGWQFCNGDESLFDLTGSTMILRFRARGLNLTKSTATDDDFVLDLAESTAVWTPPLDEAAQFPVGKVAKYELERRIGTFRRVLVQGYVDVKDWV
jgi:hypothetical protein